MGMCLLSPLRCSIGNYLYFLAVQRELQLDLISLSLPEELSDSREHLHLQNYSWLLLKVTVKVTNIITKYALVILKDSTESI